MPLEFTETNPLVVDIEKDADGWDLHVSNTEIIGGKTHKEKMSERVDRDKNGNKKIPGEFKKRRASGSPKRPHFMEHHDHTPIVIDEAETVEFRCNREFVIYFERDPSVTPFEGPENNPLSDPFRMGLPVRVPVIAGFASLKKTVTTSMAGKGPKDQMYYKCTVWLIDDDGQTVEIDPDLICGNF